MEFTSTFLHTFIVWCLGIRETQKIFSFIIIFYLVVPAYSLRLGRMRFESVMIN
jgi:hypothetical protein